MGRIGWPLEVLRVLAAVYFLLVLLNKISYICSPPWCLYFDVVEGLAWSNDLESYVGGSIATARSTYAGQVEGDDPD
jgi:hypothetical protein